MVDVRSRFSSAPIGPTELKPFGRALRTGKRLRRTLIGGTIAFCFVYGFIFAFLAPYLLVPIAFPVVVLAALVLWALPTTGKAPIKQLEFLFYAFVVALVMWPNYLAIALPGLPWITVLRLVGLPLGLALLTCLSVSADFRSELSTVLRETPWLWRLICAFILLQALSILFSAEAGASLDLWANDLTNCVSLFFAGCFVFTRNGRAERFAALLCIMGVALGGIAFWEHRLNHVVWAGHIPSFLQVNDPVVQKILAGTVRLHQSQFRSQATFSTSLGLSEFVALTTPFLLHFAANRYRPAVRAAAICALPIVLGAAVLSQARTGMIGIVVAFIVYPLARAFLHWRRNQGSLVASSTVFLSPLLALSGLGVVFAVPALRYRVLGGGGEQYSNQSRLDQLHLGLPKILSHPWGYGIGQGAKVLGYFTAGGNLTIDSYPLRLAIEYGLFGLLLYYGIFLSAVYYVSRDVLRSERDNIEENMFIPVAIALLSWMLMKIFFAQEDNQPIVYIILGMLMALRFRAAERRRKMAPSQTAMGDSARRADPVVRNPKPSLTF